MSESIRLLTKKVNNGEQILVSKETVYTLVGSFKGRVARQTKHKIAQSNST